MLRFHNALGVACWLWLLLVAAVGTTTAFVPSTRQGVTTTSLQALTERQMQFWEDVEDGLKDIEEFYQKKDMSIDRIWGFCER